MLAVVKSGFIDEKVDALRELQRRVAATKRTRKLGEVRYPADLQAKVCEWVNSRGISYCVGAKAIGISPPTLKKWLDKESSFRVVNIVDSEELSKSESQKLGLAEIQLGSRAIIRMPVASIGTSLLKSLAQL